MPQAEIDEGAENIFSHLRMATFYLLGLATAGLLTPTSPWLAHSSAPAGKIFCALLLRLSASPSAIRTTRPLHQM